MTKGCEYENKSFSVAMGGSDAPTDQEATNKAFQDRQLALLAQAAENEKAAINQHEEEVKKLTDTCFFEPLNDRILVVPALLETHGGRLKDVKKEDGSVVAIYKPDEVKKNSKKATNQGTVVQVGPGQHLHDGTFIKMNVKQGDEIMYEQFGFSEVNVQDVYCHVIRMEDVLGRRVSS